MVGMVKKMATAATAEKKKKFLELFRQTGNVTTAAEAIGLNRATPYKWREKDPEFAAAWDMAVEEAADRLEQEAWRRAVEGVEEPVYQGGKLVGKVRKYSDTLLIFLLKGNRPEKYADRVKQEISGPAGGPIEMKKYESLTDDQLDALISEKIAALGKAGITGAD